jgi:hypothetical protein
MKSRGYMQIRLIRANRGKKKKPPAPCSAGGFRSSFAGRTGETRSD